MANIRQHLCEAFMESQTRSANNQSDTGFILISLHQAIVCSCPWSINMYMYNKIITIILKHRKSNESTLICGASMGMENESVLAHLSRRLIGELIVHPCSGVHPPVVVVDHNAQTFLRKHLANQSQILC